MKKLKSIIVGIMTAFLLVGVCPIYAEDEVSNDNEPSYEEIGKLGNVVNEINDLDVYDNYLLESIRDLDTKCATADKLVQTFYSNSAKVTKEEYDKVYKELIEAKNKLVPVKDESGNVLENYKQVRVHGMIKKYFGDGEFDYSINSFNLYGSNSYLSSFGAGYYDGYYKVGDKLSLIAPDHQNSEFIHWSVLKAKGTDDLVSTADDDVENKTYEFVIESGDYERLAFDCWYIDKSSLKTTDNKNTTDDTKTSEKAAPKTSVH